MRKSGLWRQGILWCLVAVLGFLVSPPTSAQSQASQTAGARTPLQEFLESRGASVARSNLTGRAVHLGSSVGRKSPK